jgi:cation diffusion facilitator CzcD-associated flavoprotein CzcO
MPATETLASGTTAATPSQTTRQDDAPRHVHVAIVGSGFAGLGMAIRLKQRGMHDFVVLERADDVGGTWRDNHYPGCQCDVPSHLYSFSFAPNPTWSRTFSRQPEIQAYLRRCAEDAGVTPHLRFGHAVTAAAWDEDAQLWRIDTAGAPFTARMLVAAPGGLSEPSVPSIPGIERFEGKVFHSAEWDHDHDLEGERVAVIGTGASAIQFVPQIQPRVGRLHLFQRTPAWIMPHADRPLSRLERRVYGAFPAAQRLMRAGIYWARETFVLGFLHRRLMRMPARIARRHLRSQVADPELRAKLTPDYQIGCKRILISNDFYPSLAKPNVEVVTDGVREVRESSIVDAAGVEREVDTIIFGTGFQVAQMPIAERVRGRDGQRLADAWRDGMQAHLGTTVAGFPNLFIVPGPNTGLGHTSMVFMIESQIAYVLDSMRVMDELGAGAVNVRPEVQAAYNAAVQEDMKGTVWLSGCASWYLDASGRNRTLWPGFTFAFRRRTSRFDPAHYELRAAVPAPVPAAG